MPDIQTKSVLFDSDGGEDNVDINELYARASLKRKLKDMKICTSSDSRFALDERFLDFANDEAANETSHPTVSENISDNGVDSIDVENKNRAKKQIKEMIRYDPLNPDHKKYVIGSTPEKIEDSSKKKKIKLKDTQSDEKTTTVRVSKVQYSKSFSESLKNIGKETGGFSLSQILGQTNIDNASNERILQNNLQINNDELNFESGKKNPFKYDSSDESSEEENEEIDVSYKKKLEHNKSDVNAIKTNRFFSTSTDDLSIQEAYAFFNPENKKGIEDHSKKRRMLKEIVRKKVRNSTRNMKKKKRVSK